MSSSAPDPPGTAGRSRRLSERFWLNLQGRYDLEIEKDRLSAALDQIKPLRPA